MPSHEVREGEKKNYIEIARDILATKIQIEGDLLDLYTLLVFTKGIDTDLIDVHDAWAIWRNNTNPNHKSILPFGELTLEMQELDREYCDAIRATALETEALTHLQ